ncbi:MAG TPA: hypothetical protein VLH79_11760, partial [Chthonomonadales bacterium]|nr:hypothetical protein [Chthonomonadales bacterium]
RAAVGPLGDMVMLRSHVVQRAVGIAASLTIALLLAGCGSGGSRGLRIVVNSTDDEAVTRAPKVTLRAAIAQAGPNDTVVFAPALNGATINLTIVGEEHTMLPAEVYAGNAFAGYQVRNHGPSSLFADHNLMIDASNLPLGVTIRWAGGDANRARVLAVRGNLTMRNVTITGGHSAAVPIQGGTQPFTLARGGGLAVWGLCKLERCTVWGNQCTGDDVVSRDRGVYGGGIYANDVELVDTVVSGNTVTGIGAGGGGIYSVGGSDLTTGSGLDTVLLRSTVSGNRVVAQHAYGGGIFTLGGGPNNLATMRLENSTIARNVVEDHPGLPNVGQFYYRGGGVYMGGGSLTVIGCTIVENEVNGPAATFHGRPNVGGGGVAATIGNAHTVEDVNVRQSIVAGNRLNGAPEDWFTGSLLRFFSQGYNLFGKLDFTWILVPVPDWMHLNRKHYPVTGDQDGVQLAQAVDVAGAQRHGTAISAGTDAGQPAALWYPPVGLAFNRVPRAGYEVRHVHVGYTGFRLATDDFLNHVLARIRTKYGAVLGSDFGASFGDLTGTTWHGPPVTWPSDPANAAWIGFWRGLDREIDGRLGQAGLAGDFWNTFEAGALSANLQVSVTRRASTFRVLGSDQLRRARPSGSMGDIGAIER